MKITDIFRIVRRNILLLLLFPLLLASLVFYKTKDEEKEYSSSFVVYTGLASGYDLNTEEHPRLDHNAVNNAFDNLLTTLKTRETLEEVGIRLLASHLRLEKPDPGIISQKNLLRVKSLVPDSIETKVVKAKDLDEAITLLYKYKYASGNNAIKALLVSGYEIYGIPLIGSKLSATRKGYSDMLEVSYSANDPAICQQTLYILSEVFIRRYKEIKRGEINNVVAYFEEQTLKSREKLKDAEEALKRFEIDHKIINYTEQTKGISESKQELLESIQKEKLIQSAAASTVKNLEAKLSFRKGLMETNDKILSKRQKLSELNYKIANRHLYENKPEELEKIKEEAETIKEEIRVIVNDLYQINNSAEGFQRNDLMTQWLNNLLVLDESTARLSVMENRKREFEGIYNEFAPLGATLTRLNREIEVAEKEYLDILNTYNINKQRQQNIELGNNVRIVDSPYYPTEPKSSKRMVLVAGSFVAGFVLIFSVLFAIEFFDNKIKTTGRAEQVTELKLVGALPYVRKNEKRFDVEYLENSLTEQAISAIILEIKQRTDKVKSPWLIMISSARAGEGKTWCAYKLASKFSEIKGKGLYLYPEDRSGRANDNVEIPLSDAALDLKEYPISIDFVNKTAPMELVKENMEFANYSFVIIEVPSLSENQLPVGLVKNMDISLLVLRADRVWTETDKYVTKLYRKACKCEPILLLNRVSPDGLKEIFGEIPKRSKRKSIQTKIVAEKNTKENVL